MVRTKVFVGNISFSTTEAELAQEFGTAGKVLSANIITRGPRSLGYGFVEMDSEADAENAVKTLDKKELGGRPINVEVAKIRPEGTDAKAPNTGSRAPNTGANTGDNNAPRGGRGGRGSSRPRGGRGGSFGTRSNMDNTSGSQQQQSGQQQQQSGQPRRGGRRQFDEEGGDANRQRRERPPRAPRVRTEGEDTRSPSLTTLFVANLPFALTDEGFAKILKDANLAYSKVHVVTKRTGRSKGFGFIDFDNQADQSKALDALNNKDVEGRPISVKVALVPRSDETSPNTSAPVKTSSPAPTNTSSPAPVKATGGNM